jgi:hypothetical protein
MGNRVSRSCAVGQFSVAALLQLVLTAAENQFPSRSIVIEAYGCPRASEAHRHSLVPRYIVCICAARPGSGCTRGTSAPELEVAPGRSLAEDVSDIARQVPELPMEVRIPPGTLRSDARLPWPGKAPL